MLMNLHLNLFFNVMVDFNSQYNLYVYVDCTCFVFYHCWCSIATSSHLRETWSYSMSSWHHHTLSHHNNSLGWDHHIMPFIDVKAEECIEHVSDKENEQMEDYRNSYRASIHGFYIECVHYFVNIQMRNSYCTFIGAQNFSFIYFLQCL